MANHYMKGATKTFSGPCIRENHQRCAGYISLACWCNCHAGMTREERMKNKLPPNKRFLGHPQKQGLKSGPCIRELHEDCQRKSLSSTCSCPCHGVSEALNDPRCEPSSLQVETGIEDPS